MEGVAGITNWHQVSGGENGEASALFQEGRRLYTAEMNAAIAGARAGGATEIAVADGHGAGHGWQCCALLIEELDQDIELVVQNEWTDYIEEYEDGRCDAVMMVGMHARAGTYDGPLNHSVHGSAWLGVRFNGQEVGELGINSALAGTWDVPVVLVTGDEAICREGRDLLGEQITTVAVKRGYGSQSAVHKMPKRAREMIFEGAKESLRDLSSQKPYKPGEPCTIEVEFATSRMIEQFRHHHFVEVVGTRHVRWTGENWWDAWKRFFFSYQWPDWPE
jgi:D-amino peptidase